MKDEFDTTMTRALTEAEARSIALAQEAMKRGEIEQVETVPGSGVWKLGKNPGSMYNCDVGDHRNYGNERCLNCGHPAMDHDNGRCPHERR